MKRYFQWLVGDDRGKVVELVDITQEDGEYFFNFDDGESCNMSYICAATNDKKKLINKAMVEVPGPYNAWKFEEIKMGTFTTAEHEVVDVPPLEDIVGMNGDNSLDKSALGTMNLIPPKNNPIKGMPLPSIQEYLREEQKSVRTASNISVTVHDNTHEHAVVDNNAETAEEPAHMPQPRIFTPPQRVSVDETDPVYILVKTCKKHESSVDLKIALSLPSISTYNFAKSEFEDGDKKFIDAIANSITVETVMNALKDALRNAYENGGDS